MPNNKPSPATPRPNTAAKAKKNAATYQLKPNQISFVRNSPGGAMRFKINLNHLVHANRATQMRATQTSKNVKKMLLTHDPSLYEDIEDIQNAFKLWKSAFDSAVHDRNNMYNSGVRPDEYIRFDNFSDLWTADQGILAIFLRKSDSRRWTATLRIRFSDGHLIEPHRRPFPTYSDRNRRDTRIVITAATSRRISTAKLPAIGPTDGTGPWLSILIPIIQKDLAELDRVRPGPRRRPASPSPSPSPKRRRLFGSNSNSNNNNNRASQRTA